MSTPLRLQFGILLLIVQAALGFLALLVNAVYWLTLAIAVLYFWFLVRIAMVLRAEIQLGMLAEGVSPRRDLWLVAAVWQLPSLLTLPLWAPASVDQVWQGAIAPIQSGLSLVWPVAFGASGWGIWAFWLPEVLLMTAVATIGLARPEKVAPRPVELHVEEGDWMPARRRQDIRRK